MNKWRGLNIKINRHPIFWVADLLHQYMYNNVLTRNARLEFSKYKYIPQSYYDERIVFTLPIVDLNKSSLFDLLMDLEDDEELALHSTVFDIGSAFHMPLIDFGGKDSRLFEPTLKEFCSYWGLEFQAYSSGRSYHAYGNRLLSQNEWISFMGSLLLLNMPGSSKIIDDRWVGHRILAGYSSLRWSKNTSKYKKYPTHIGYFNEQGFYDELTSFGDLNGISNESIRNFEG
ncbi:hypothetical protein [Citrobacter braakii]|uniref:primase 1D-like protein n=1 Tax=Citrobacter braakii TaxID=57706 RepID=UPI00242D0313|nr:hypothetical protein [Citrobacter braakii]WFX95302.1 hypothetical protein NFK19_00330 [Citrobacter braakii]WFY04346.1 hypothetical protein NFK21_00330 [Citrobacter braakii]